MTHFSQQIADLHACSDAVAWLEAQPDPETAWATCQRGEWMLWLAGKLAGTPGSPNHKQLVSAACACARLALVHVKINELRPLCAIETAEAWANDMPGVTLNDVRNAANAANAATYAATYAAYAADAADANTQAKCADLVRQFYPTCPFKEVTK